ncbi:MAG: hypothetical protein A2622_04870 [Bdellovibrionales bacterium RIFCSPHIGHO2_01_FULL_40_29]|nr:MAG: hypothetical protein A2622_04870 [Bdellovibrionales bacterium RIFCSPHIGHO2_01_FULL_40_29]OFZ34734.1 MAG: hypothetical protein A3D17_10500 [Bdellovibrionales bacterium RIFCSPHIGHO2_02_FULL_40_15]
MKSLNNVGHLIIFDLSKLGSAYQLINSFVDERTVFVFEVSPVGDRALLILSCHDLISSQLIFSQAQSLFQSEILKSTLIENVENDVVLAYLSQKQSPCRSHFLILEENYFSLAFKKAQELFRSGVEIMDFRAIRTNPPNLVVTMTHDSVDFLNSMLMKLESGKATIVADVQPSLKAFFEIVK